MQKEPKRFTITVPQELGERLRALQEKEYPQSSRNDMLVDLIRAGLEAAGKEEQE